MNQFALSAHILEIKPLRYTPGGVPALELLLEHQSNVVQAGHPRQVNLQIQALALGDMANLLAQTPLGTLLQTQGFLAAARKGSTRLVFHIQNVKSQYAGQGSTTV
ncbi:primosomal replication protein N [Alcaligenes endophyticus]|uniref:Replication restart protein PriB n=1 Tax=Alcaligenes endophyticus TaxID=1929088 RepID=A0ABT8EN99_9BURK|nr:primosomal replication protein N [Alcaligenes endophyticus]MCX5591332.1 primosomal replication protein N [Alcaligenes endophyticus]MDN4122787.1 primosomal replication protein N [Alcaligenes endophyticus]